MRIFIAIIFGVCLFGIGVLCWWFDNKDIHDGW